MAIYDISHPHDLRAVLRKPTMSTEEIDAFLASTDADADLKQKLLADVRPQGYAAAGFVGEGPRLREQREAALTQEARATAEGVPLIDQALAIQAAKMPPASLAGPFEGPPLTPMQAMIWALYLTAKHQALPGAKKGDVDRHARACRKAHIGEQEIAAAIAAGELVWRRP